jgi:hypothetical protein
MKYKLTMQNLGNFLSSQNQEDLDELFTDKKPLKKFRDIYDQQEKVINKIYQKKSRKRINKYSHMLLDQAS